MQNFLKMSKIDQREEKNTHIEARSEAKRPFKVLPDCRQASYDYPI